MSETLSQSEIDALLSQAQAEGNSPEPTSPQKEKAVFTYNFRKKKKFNKSHYVLLESIHKRFLRNFEVTLTNVLNSPILATLAAATELSYSDCMDSFSSPTCIYIFNVNNGLGKFILEIDPNVAFFIIDKILGGNSKEIHPMDRELSLIEEKIMHRVVNFLIHDLIDAWESVDRLQIELEAFYAQPDYVQVISNTETVILISMDVRGSDKTLGYLNMSLPSSSLEQLLARYEGSHEEIVRTPAQCSTDRQDIEQQIRNAVLPFKVVLGKTRMRVHDVVNLEEGDVIFLPTKPQKPVDVYVGNLNLYKAYPVKKENTVAVKISDVIRK